MDKAWTELLEADRIIRDLSPNKGMTRGTEPQIRVTLIRGFELFNTRPYHNYETWADGYIIEAFGDDGSVIAEVSAEDLDDALNELSKRLQGV